VVATLQGKLPPRLSLHASLDGLRACAAFDTIPLDEGEELLLSIDAILGDGSGRLLENIGGELASRLLSQGGPVARSGDLAGTVARLQAFLEHPFIGVPFLFELRRNPTGFSLTVGIAGHSRATRAVRHLTIGAIAAVERFARQVGADRLTLQAESIADRAHITARYLPLEEAVAEDPPPPPSRRRVPARAPVPSLSAEVERILRSTTPPRKPSEPSAASDRAQTGASRRQPTPLPVRRSAPPAPAPPEPAEPQPPESMTVRISTIPAARGPASK
jgi:hypothetical protein